MTAQAAAIPPAPPGAPRVAIAGEPTAGWLDAWAAGEGRADAQAHVDTVFALLDGRAAYLLAEDGSGQALVVTEGHWAGIFCMAVAPPARARGVARAMLAAAARLGASRLFLQVDPANAAAQGLYRSSGFTRRYGYHFRVAQRE
jgi:ribosomal protein S18 acetylase RimI-like enzyme